MAPHKHGNQEDLHEPLIPSVQQQQQIQSSQESLSEQSSSSLLLGDDDQLNVIVVQPEGHARASLNNDEDATASVQSAKRGVGGDLNKRNKKNGSEVPVNCPHLETALFFFGIAGMIVSLILLLQHIIGNLISYY